MNSHTCAYVASKDDPESWHGTDPSHFLLDDQHRGLGISEWRCPHPPLGQEDGDQEYCIFHTEAEVSANQQQKELLKALDNAGERPWDDRPEHRGQFVGATFSAINLSGETIAATDDYDIRFDHARFQAKRSNLFFRNMTFETQGQYPVSFVRAEFSTHGSKDIAFTDTTFRTNGDGDVVFDSATFRTTDGDVGFGKATFVTTDDGTGDVAFNSTTFRTNGDGNVFFYRAKFITNGSGDVMFYHATFKSDGDGYLLFQDTEFITNVGGIMFSGTTFRTTGTGNIEFKSTTFRANGDGNVVFRETTFRTEDGEVGFQEVTFGASSGSYVRFNSTTFRIDGDGSVRFRETAFGTGDNSRVTFNYATFGTNGDGSVVFQEATLTDASFQNVDFNAADLQKAELTGSDLREASVSGVSVNGATTCNRLHEESQFEPEDWDATARTYHNLKTVFSGHGLVGKARAMHVRERRARRLEAKATYGLFDRGYLRTLPSWIFTGYGVQVRNLGIWMLALFLFSTGVYVIAGVNETFVENVSYSVLAFTVAPPEVPEGVGTQIMMMVETFFGTLSIVLLGYILGNRERF